MKADFTYFADGRTAAKDDLLSDAWDRTMKYDFAGRLTNNEFGMGTASDPTVGTREVYRQTLQYDAFSQMTSRATVHWDNDNGFTATYTNGRKNPLSGEGLTYDAAGNITHEQPSTSNPDTYQDTTYDAAGRRVTFHGKTKGRQGGWLNYISEDKTEQVFDGDGRPVAESSGHRSYNLSSPPSGDLTTTVTGYQIWSSVLGAALTSLDASGNKSSTNVYAGGAVIARQNRVTSGGASTDTVGWTTMADTSRPARRTSNSWARRSTRTTRQITQARHQARPSLGMLMIQSGSVNCRRNFTGNLSTFPFIAKSKR